VAEVQVILLVHLLEIKMVLLVVLEAAQALLDTHLVAAQVTHLLCLLPKEMLE
jgi:hypothetical protein